MLSLLDIDKSNVGIMHQRRRLQRLTRLLVCEPRRCELAQFVIDKWQQLVRLAGIALCNL